MAEPLAGGPTSAINVDDAVYAAFVNLDVPAAVFVDGRVQVVNEALHALLKATDDVAVGGFGDRVAGDALPRLRAAAEQSRAARRPMRVENVPITAFDGERIDVTCVVRGFEFDGRDATVITLRDYDEVHEEMRRAALTDSLTGAIRREVFVLALERAIAAKRRRSGLVALAFVDIDGLKALNDGRGHAAGDELIAIVAGRLLGSVRPEDVVGRFGGDEFVVLLTTVESLEAAELVADRIVRQTNTPALIRGQHTDVSVSVGLAVSAGTISADELIDAADEAMYDAKRAGDRSPHVVIVD